MTSLPNIAIFRFPSNYFAIGLDEEASIKGEENFQVLEILYITKCWVKVQDLYEIVKGLQSYSTSINFYFRSYRNEVNLI